MTDFAQLTRKQTILYRKVVSDMEQKVRQMEAEHSISQFAQKGIVLTAIMKLKQICNHPDQYLGQDVYTPSESGKFQLLKEICETIYEKRERVLVLRSLRRLRTIWQRIWRPFFMLRAMCCTEEHRWRSGRKLWMPFREKPMYRLLCCR